MDSVVTPSGQTVAGNYPTFPKNVPRVTETVVKAAPGSITPQGGRTAFITKAARIPEDGDTAYFDDPNNPDGKPTLACRLNRIEAPEVQHPAKDGRPAKAGQPYGEESRKTLQDMIMNKEVTVTVTKLKDKYGKRSVCEIEVNGENINQKMLEEGAAWVYRTFGKGDTKPTPQDYAAERVAKANKLGLFADKNAEYPLDFKKRLDQDKGSWLDFIK